MKRLTIRDIEMDIMNDSDKYSQNYNNIIRIQEYILNLTHNYNVELI